MSGALVIGVQEREPHGGMIYPTTLYFGPTGASSASTESWCQPVRSGPSGAWATRADARSRRRMDRGWRVDGGRQHRNPNGEIAAGPARQEETILYTDLDLAAVRAARRLLDPVGHYHRPDVFRLTVDTRPRPSVVEVSRDLTLEGLSPPAG